MSSKVYLNGQGWISQTWKISFTPPLSPNPNSPYRLEKNPPTLLLQTSAGIGGGGVYRSPRSKPNALRASSNSDGSPPNSNPPSPRQRRLTANGIHDLLRSIENAAEAATQDPSLQQVIEYEGPAQLSEGGISVIIKNGIKNRAFTEDHPLMIVEERHDKEHRRRITREFFQDDNGNVKKRRESSELLSVEATPNDPKQPILSPTVSPPIGLSAETSTQVKAHIAGSLSLARTNVTIRYRGSSWLPEDTAEIEENLRKLTYIGKEGAIPPRFTIVMSHAALRKEIFIHWEKDESGIHRLQIDIRSFTDPK